MCNKALVSAVLMPLAILGSDIAARAQETGSRCTADLRAGGGPNHVGTDAGDVTVTENADGTWDVEYRTAGRWELAKIHLDVACRVRDVPQTRKGNPKLGHFCVKADVPAGRTSRRIDGIGPGECHQDTCACAVFAAHASVVETVPCAPSEGVVYGIGRRDPTLIYRLNPADGSVAVVATFPDPSPTRDPYPNGLTYDRGAGRFYFSAFDDADTGEPSLYFASFGTNAATFAGFLSAAVGNAAMHDGEYYFFREASDDLLKLAFRADGTIAEEILVCGQLTNDAVPFSFGDIVVTPDGSRIYGASRQPGNFFVVDLASCEYVEICSGTTLDTCMGGANLAWGSNGILYAARGGQEYVVDPTTGAGSLVAAITVPLGFTDLADGEPCLGHSESAWADGYDLPGPNGATYFQCGACE